MQVVAGKSSKVQTSVLSKVRSYAVFAKMRLTSLVVISAVAGYFIGMDQFSLKHLLALIVGGLLVTASSNGFNQIIEKDLDALMNRTKNRPLPTGQMSVREGLIVAGTSGIIGIFLLWNLIHPLCGILGALSLFVYVAMYTPLKRVSSIAVFVGAFPGAIPPLLGYVAARGTFDLEGGVLYAIQFIWQFPHFWAIAWKSNDDYQKAGFKLLPSRGGKNGMSAFQIFFYTLILIPVSVLPVVFGFVSLNGAIGILIIGLLFLVPATKLVLKKDDKSATQLMYWSFIYLPVILLLILIFKQ